MMGKLLIVTVAFGLALATLAGWAGAQSGTPTVTAEDYRFVGPDGTAPAAVSIAPGDAVTFSYPAGMSIHDVHFSGAAPACAGGQAQVGGAPTAAAAGWSATCSFAAAGSYTFHCDVHPGMTGTITVAAPAPAATPMTTTGAAPPPAATTMTPTGAGPPPPPSYSPPTSGPPPAPSAAPRAAPAASRLVAAAVQHASSVAGQVTIARGGSSLTASVLGATGARQTLGRLVRSSLPAGRRRFSVRLGAAGRRALAAHGQLAVRLSVRVTLGRGGPATVLGRMVLLRR
jgi:plastocyanin